MAYSYSTTRPVEKFPPVKYSYKSKNIKSYTPEETKPMKIPESPADAGITNAMSDKIKFNLNMNWGKGGYNPEKHFDRLYSIYPEAEIDSLYQYVFIVRPDTNILNPSTNELQTISASGNDLKPRASSCPSNDQLLRYMKDRYEYMLYHLSSSGFEGHDFMPYLVGRTESLQVPDIELKEYTVSQPYSGYTLPYASHAYASVTGGQCELTFRDDIELRLHKLFNTWIYYINAVTTNQFEPKFKHIVQNRMDYACSIYCITCKADAKTIVFWSKYTGAFPKIAPNSDLSYNRGSNIENKLRISFNYFKQECLDPYILIDFNKNSHVISDPSKRSYMPIYQSETLKQVGFKKSKGHSKSSPFNKGASVSLGSGNGLVGAPFVCINNIGDYELRWKKISSLSP